jgi:hypothetical protein
MKQKYFYNITWLLCLVLLAAACSEDDYETPVAKNALQNDCIKRSLGPNIVGSQIEFAYAIALPQSLGSLSSAKVEASIAGAAGTFLENRAFYTNTSGIDTPVKIGEPSSTSGGLTEVTFSRDTFATTLRYFYVVPEEARGQSVKFKFSGTDSNGTTVSYDMGPYTISSMDMVLDRVVTDNAACYISIADMAVYTAAQAATIPDKIDLVYLNRTITGVSYGHALVAPAADPAYLPSITLPAGVDNNTKVIKNLNLRDYQLARQAIGVYIDDLDFKQLEMSTAANYMINLSSNNGAWIETEDGKYRAFVHINSVTTGTPKTMTISIKRLQMK